MLRFPRLEIGDRHSVVGVRGRLCGHVDDHERADELRERHRVNRPLPSCEVDGGIEVRSPVLRRLESVRGVEPPAIRHAFLELLELEALPIGGPVDRIRVVRVRQVDDLGWIDVDGQCGRAEQHRDDCEPARDHDSFHHG